MRVSVASRTSFTTHCQSMMSMPVGMDGLVPLLNEALWWAEMRASRCSMCSSSRVGVVGMICLLRGLSW